MKKRRTCDYCGIGNNPSQVPAFREEYNQFLCHKCYIHHKEHPINKKPKKGIMGYDDEGRVICHICGRAYNRLTTHLRLRHKICKDDYLEEFGLNRTQKLTSERHRKKLIDSSTTLDNVIKFRNTSLNVTCPRKNKKTRLQGLINMRLSQTK